MIGPQLHGAPVAGVLPVASDDARASDTTRSWPADTLAMTLVVAVALLMWVPRQTGPIDMRWDGAVYYILGTSLAEGRGYKLLNEPGEIDAVQYPPLLPAVVAVHQMLLGTTDPTTVGVWLRRTCCVVFIVYAVVVMRFFRMWLPVPYALLGSLLSLFCLHAWFLSDTLFPEVWFSVATLLFLISARRDGSAIHSMLAYFWAVVAYALRTVGLAGLAVWVLESVIRRRFRQAAIRAVLALIPVASWQTYVMLVERSPEYNRPAYEYQRAPYLFYNVSYARNISLRDPFTPEKGPVRIERRVVRNGLHMPLHFGEALSVSRGYFDVWLHSILGSGTIATQVIGSSVFTLLSLFGGLLVLCGIALQLRAGLTLVPLYILIYAAALCLTPFPAQYLRYLTPIAPLLALSAIVFLVQVGRARHHSRQAAWPRTKLPFVVLGPALLGQIITAATVYGNEYGRVDYVDAAGKRVSHRLFFYGASQREFEQAVDYLQAHAQPGDVVAAGTPHWIYLRTGLKTVMPPFEADPARAQALLETVPVRYLVIGKDVVATERYTVPVVRQFEDRWERVYSTPGGWVVYRRTE